MAQTHRRALNELQRKSHRGGRRCEASKASVLLLLIALASPCLAANLVEVRAISHPDFVRVIFETDRRVAYSIRNQSATPLRFIEVKLPVIEARRVVWKSAPPLASIGVEGVGAAESVVRLAVDQAVYVWLSARQAPPRIVVDLRPVSASAEAGSDPLSAPLRFGAEGGAPASPPGEEALAAFHTRLAEPRAQPLQGFRVVVVPHWELDLDSELPAPVPAAGGTFEEAAGSERPAAEGERRPPSPQRAEGESSPTELAARDAATTVGNFASRRLLSGVPGWFAIAVPWLLAAALWGVFEWRAASRRRLLSERTRVGRLPPHAPAAPESAEAAGSSEVLPAIEAETRVQAAEIEIQAEPAAVNTAGERGVGAAIGLDNVLRRETIPPAAEEVGLPPASSTPGEALSDFLPLVHQLDRRVAELEREFEQTSETLADLRELCRNQDEALRAQRIALTRLLRRAEAPIPRDGQRPSASSS